MRPYSQALRIALVSLALFVCFALGSGIAMRGITQPAQSGAQGNTALTLLLVCLLQSLVMSYLILRSRWSGLRLIAAVFVVFYGVTTFMPQIESAVFLTQLPPGVLPRLFLMGVLVGVPFSILAVLILGRMKTTPTGNGESQMTRAEWGWKLAVIAVAYVILYFTFGYYIAWRTPAVREYYGGADPGNFLAQMQSVMRNTPWLIAFQIFRGLCWAGIALIIIRMLKGRRFEIALALAFTFAVVMNAPLLLANPYMPEPVRMAHLLETASSNFILGLLIGWLLAPG